MFVLRKLLFEEYFIFILSFFEEYFIFILSVVCFLLHYFLEQSVCQKSRLLNFWLKICLFLPLAFLILADGLVKLSWFSYTSVMRSAADFSSRLHDNLATNCVFNFYWTFTINSVFIPPLPFGQRHWRGPVQRNINGVLHSVSP